MFDYHRLNSTEFGCLTSKGMAYWTTLCAIICNVLFMIW